MLHPFYTNLKVNNKRYLCNCATQCINLTVVDNLSDGYILVKYFMYFLLCLIFEEEVEKDDLDTLTKALVIDFYHMFYVEKFLPEFFALSLLCSIIWHLRI